MKSIALLVAALAFFVATTGFCADSEKSEIVASYPNKPAFDKVGSRVAELLRAQGIRCMMPASAGVSVNVPANRAAEARKILARAIQSEGLQVRLEPPGGKGHVEVEPADNRSPTTKGTAHRNR